LEFIEIWEGKTNEEKYWLWLFRCAFLRPYGDGRPGGAGIRDLLLQNFVQ
jgi:hypothetical protein